MNNTNEKWLYKDLTKEKFVGKKKNLVKCGALPHDPASPVRAYV